MSTAHARVPEPLAPWAEVVPNAPAMTAADLLTLEDDGSCYEVVEGVLVRMAGSLFDATTIAFILGAALLAHVRPRSLGAITGADGVYSFPSAANGLLPDVGFVRADLVPLIDRTKPIPLAPDLAVEVASPSQHQDDMDAKARRYLSGGTRLVWVVWPQTQTVDVWRPGDTRPAATLTTADVLNGEDIIPDFIHPIADIFA